jgi:DNA-binding HxlR family transcriptional regulator
MPKNYTPDSAAQDVEVAFRLLEGRWKLVILFHLFGGKVLRFSDLERAIPKVEYSLTTWCQALCPALDAILQWADLRDREHQEVPRFQAKVAFVSELPNHSAARYSLPDPSTTTLGVLRPAPGPQ